MKVVILEDELSAQKRLESMLKQIRSDIVVLAVIESIEDALLWFSQNKEPDLIFADIQLCDGLSFEIFKKITVECAVIFTTAYNEYATQAFKVNSIDYLLKPIDEKELVKSLEKYHRVKEKYTKEATVNLESFLKQVNKTKTEYKSRFLVKTGETLQSIAIEDIRYFMIDDQLAFLFTKENRRFIIDHNLDELEKMLNPSDFFKINRQMIVSFISISAIHPYFNGRLKLDLKPQTQKEVLVSRKRVNAFKHWLDR